MNQLNINDQLKDEQGKYLFFNLHSTCDCLGRPQFIHLWTGKVQTC